MGTWLFHWPLLLLLFWEQWLRLLPRCQEDLLRMALHGWPLLLLLLL